MQQNQKRYFAYIRVSVQQKKGQEGVSLPEQKAEIEQFAQRQGLSVVQWFTETKTAASSGRPVFNQMLRLLRRGKADGVLIHKIDRSARNYRDWHDLGILLDNGSDVRFCHENLDLRSRGGRLAADMMAVIATDYIRNLRDETLKGIRGRLRQGLYPTSAPIGYLDTGRGNPKTPDPVTAPLVRYAFEQYATGMVGLHQLRGDLNRKGMRNKRGGEISLNGLSTMLNNAFYIGIIRMRRWDEVFAGIHEPLIDVDLFRRVEAILNERAPKKVDLHAFPYRRLVTCKQCGLKLIGERQKGHVYYRCHTRGCPTTCVREEVIETTVLETLDRLPRHKEEIGLLEKALHRHKDSETHHVREAIAATKGRLGQIERKLTNLTDTWLDEMIDRDTYQEMREKLLFERQGLREKIDTMERGGFTAASRIAKFLELSKLAYPSFKSANPQKKRELLLELTSNRWACGKNVDIELDIPFSLLAEWPVHVKGDPQQDTARTAEMLIDRLIDETERGNEPESDGLGQAA